MAGIVFLIYQVEQEQKMTRQAAVDRVSDAQKTMADFVSLGAENRALQQEVLHAAMMFETNHVPSEKIRELDAVRNQYRTALIQRERLFNQALEYLEQAERLDPDVVGTDLVRAELYVLRYREALTEGNHVAQRFYRERAHHFDDGSVWKEMMTPTRVRLAIDPPGPVTIFPFRYLEHDQIVPGGDPRMVPVPGLAGDPLPSPEEIPLTPGTWCLHVIEDRAPALTGDYLFEISGAPIQGSIFVLGGNARPEPHQLPGVARLDRLIQVDGTAVTDAYTIDKLIADPQQPRSWMFARGEEVFTVDASWKELDIELGTARELAAQGECTAQLLRDGKVMTIAVPPGLKTRINASPRLMLPEFAIQHTHAEQVIEMEPGVQAFVIRRVGFEDCLVQFNADDREEIEVPVPMLAFGTTPTGFVRINPKPGWQLTGYWLMDREVTAAEYLEFLNQPQILAEIKQSPEPIRFPRTIRNEHSGGSWPRDPDGRYHIASDWHPDWPAFGISWHDAVRFAEWKTEQARAQGLPYTYRLPILAEFRLGAKGNTQWDYPYGTDFRPNWSNCCFSRPKPEPEPVLRYPLDASIYGVYDMSGSALEWVDAWWDQDHIKRFAAGGSWAQGGATAAKPAAGIGMRPKSTSLETAFRLVLEIDE